MNIYVNAYVTPVVCAALRNQPIEFAASSYAHLESLPLAHFPVEGEEDLSIDILIGSNYYWLFLSGMSIRREDHRNGPVALDSRLGWILSGPVGGNSSVSSIPMNLVQTHAMQVDTKEMTLEKQLSKFWELESLGISPQENSVYETFKDGIEFVDGRYQLRLPCKQDHPLLPDNFTLAQRRLQDLNSRLQGDPNLLEEYDSIIKDQEEKGIIE